MKLMERIGIAGTSLSRTNSMAETARWRTGAFCGGQSYSEAFAGTHGVRVLALDIAGTGVANPVFRQQIADVPTLKPEWVPLCPRERRQ